MKVFSIYSSALGKILGALLVTASIFSFLSIAGVWADEADRDASSLPLELVIKADDGVASLPVFNGPFPGTKNMEFLSQIEF